MNNSIKQEFINWINQIDKKSLVDIDIKLLNIIIMYFDSLAVMGTAGGQRAKKLSELILKYKNDIATVLDVKPTEQKTKIDQIEKIYELEIGPFRGFVSQEHFIFDKKYTFLYGPNGSGKSSFFEGIEYALLGDILESDEKRIPLDSYIKNIVKNKSETPVVYCVDSSGTKRKMIQNQERYRFSLIEKNRIDNFARISATTPNEQKNRISTLFGLDAFSDFVDGFTDNFQYLPINAPKADAFSSENQKNEIKKQRLIEITNKLIENTASINMLITEIGDENINDKTKVQIFLNGQDGTSGKINQLLKQKASEIPSNIDIESFNCLSDELNNLRPSIEDLTTDLITLNSLSSDLNYKELYSAIIAIGEISDKIVCPACKTPIEQTVLDPFVNAQNEMSKLQSLTLLQEQIQEKSRHIDGKIHTINMYVSEISNHSKSVNYEQSLNSLTETIYTDISLMSSRLGKLSMEISAIEREFDKYSKIKELIIKHNDKLEEQRNEQKNIDTEIQKYTSFNTRLLELNATEKSLNEEVEKINKGLNDFNEDNKQIIEEIEKERMQIEEHKEYIASYNKLVFLLKKYRNNLPLLFSAGLSDKIKIYYNIINFHDSDFEKLENVSLPSTSGEKIMIQFLNSEDRYDALYVLSEGHIRVLGLSILLAKAVSEGLEFLIFDDIVNAIDDDHRNGIAELLMNHPDFKDREQIITCHGEMFIKLLENKLGMKKTQKEVTHYRFFSADINSIRGIIFSIGDSTHYLVQAQKHFENNELKDVASKCRQAVESIVESLWKKIGKKMKSDLSVLMRYPDSKPDLSSVVDSLIKKLEKIDKDSDIYNLFSKLKRQYMWNLLNKGTHEDDTLPEFERTDISNLLDLVKSIEEKVNAFDIVTKIET
jgi:DNA repair exonuclease SbcCD ATPase subunit